MELETVVEGREIETWEEDGGHTDDGRPISIVHIGRDPQLPYTEEEVEMDKELARLIEVYSPTEIQLKMFQAGVMPIDEFEATLEAAKDDEHEPQPYAAKYTPKNIAEADADKPELEELTAAQLENALDGRYLVHTDATELQTDVLHEFYYNQENASAMGIICLWESNTC